MSLSIATSSILAVACAELKISDPATMADNTGFSRDATVFYAQALEETIEATDWTCTSRMARLAQIADDQEGIYSDDLLPYAFLLPDDCLAVREAGDEWTRWRQDGNVLRASDPAPLPVRYSARIENEEHLSPSVRAVLALRLAMMLLPRWGNSDERRLFDIRLEEALMVARRTDARRASPETWTGRQAIDIVDGALS